MRTAEHFHQHHLTPPDPAAQSLMRDLCCGGPCLLLHLQLLQHSLVTPAVFRVSSGRFVLFQNAPIHWDILHTWRSLLVSGEPIMLIQTQEGLRRGWEAAAQYLQI